MLTRILETEVMDSAEEARDYDQMDHAGVNGLFADDFLALCPLPATTGWRVLDVGTGTARIPIAIVQRRGDLALTGVDLAAHMLDLGRQNVLQAGLVRQITLEQVDAKGLPYADGQFDAVVSNTIVHHIPEPRVAFLEMVRVLRPGGLLFVRDLFRPPDLKTLDQLVTTYAGDANPRQRQMFADSLHAALTLDEVRDLLREASLPADRVRQTSDRHWTVASVV